MLPLLDVSEEVTEIKFEKETGFFNDFAASVETVEDSNTPYNCKNFR